LVKQNIFCNFTTYLFIYLSFNQKLFKMKISTEMKKGGKRQAKPAMKEVAW
jgi:hypothetical protein